MKRCLFFLQIFIITLQVTTSPPPLNNNKTNVWKGQWWEIHNKAAKCAWIFIRKYNHATRRQFWIYTELPLNVSTERLVSNISIADRFMLSMRELVKLDKLVEALLSLNEQKVNATCPDVNARNGNWIRPELAKLQEELHIKAAMTQTKSFVDELKKLSLTGHEISLNPLQSTAQEYKVIMQILKYAYYRGLSLIRSSD